MSLSEGSSVILRASRGIQTLTSLECPSVLNFLCGTPVCRRDKGNHSAGDSHSKDFWSRTRRELTTLQHLRKRITSLEKNVQVYVLFELHDLDISLKRVFFLVLTEISFNSAALPHQCSKHNPNFLRPPLTRTPFS